MSTLTCSLWTRPGPTLRKQCGRRRETSLQQYGGKCLHCHLSCACKFAFRGSHRSLCPDFSQTLSWRRRMDSQLGVAALGHVRIGRQVRRRTPPSENIPCPLPCVVFCRVNCVAASPALAAAAGATMVKPLRKVVKIKKHKATFRRHQSDTNVSVPVRCCGADVACQCRADCRAKFDRNCCAVCTMNRTLLSPPPSPPPPRRNLVLPRVSCIWTARKVLYHAPLRTCQLCRLLVLKLIRVRNQESWRRPKGIDSRVRRKFKGCGINMPNIGYGTNKKHRHLLPSGEPAPHLAASLQQLPALPIDLRCCRGSPVAGWNRAASIAAARITKGRLSTSCCL